MKFNYTALSRDNQKLTGVLDAENINIAQDELHKMELSIISISEISEEEFSEITKKETTEKAKSGIQTFMFEAIDTTGKPINGTIDAPDDYSAYKRLLIDYRFKVNAIYAPNATEAEIAQSKEKIPEFNQRMDEEGIDLKVSTTKKRDEEIIETEVDREIIKEIDKFITGTKKILEEHKKKFSNVFFQEVSKTLGELERIRTSNNVKHISEVCNQIYELITHPDQLPEDGEDTTDASYENILDSMGDTSLIKGDLKMYRKSLALKTIQSFFNRAIGKLAGKSQSQIGLSNAGKAKKKNIFQKLLSRISKKRTIQQEGAPTAPSFSDVIQKFFSYLFAPNAILRKIRKNDFSKTYKEWCEARKRSKSEKKSSKEKVDKTSKEKPDQITEDEESAKQPKGKDFTPFFTEVDSFIAWLLFFYISYFYMVNFSFEKDLGLSREFVVKTLKTPLIINITIFLLFAHLILKLKNQYFRRNFFGSLFLIFFGIGIYVLLIVNF